MRAHYLFVLDDMLKQKQIAPPAEINGNVTPIYAWHAGYLAALDDMLKAFKSSTDDSNGAPQ